MSDTYVEVDVLIVNYLTPDLVVDSVQRLDGPGIHLYVWDNSGDLPESLAATNARVFGEDRNLFFAEASNRLFEMSSSPYVVLLNPDVLLDKGQLLQLIAALQLEPRAWGAAPRLRGVEGEDQYYVRRLPTIGRVIADRVPPARRLFRRAYQDYWYDDLRRDSECDVEQPAAACLVLRRERVGPVLFDDSYPLFFNDTDLARRLLRDGPCRYVGSVSVTHLGGESIARRRDRHWIRRDYDRSYLRYCRRNLRGWLIVAPIFAIRQLLYSLMAAVGR